MSTTLQSPSPTYELQPFKSLENDELTSRIQAVRKDLGPQLLILGHHYQQDEVIALADLRGDSYGLSQHAAQSRACRYIVFCGVHFMAETADILANRPEKLAERSGERVPVVLPDLAAGCSMADMAAIDQIEDAWEQLGEVLDAEDITPVTYINSAASLKAFVGQHGGIVCTSSNACPCAGRTSRDFAPTPAPIEGGDRRLSRAGVEAAACAVKGADTCAGIQGMGFGQRTCGQSPSVRVEATRVGLQAFVQGLAQVWRGVSSPGGGRA